MHPAFSVILFTVLSGAGYGVLFWLGVLVIAGQATRNPTLVIVSAVFAAALIVAGLLSSMAHLGRPERAWRAFSQWRSSWLSREGVAAIVSFVPLCGLVLAMSLPASRMWHVTMATGGCVMAVVTVFCTSRIYDTLKPVPAWNNRWVLANYLLLAAASGAAILWSIGVLGFALPAHRGDVAILAFLLTLAGLGKWCYWRYIDRRPMLVDAAAAMALPTGTRVTPFELPHTQANFLLKEMGFALARKHARRLRALAIALIAAVPTGLCALATLTLTMRSVVAAVLPLSVMLGMLVERWLFFAQARHVVMTYYDAGRT